MESFLIYILKASALLGIFHLCYLLLLKNETSFHLNRKFLLSGLIISAVLPAIYFTRKIYIEATPTNFGFIPASSMAQDIPEEMPTDWWQIAGIIYLIITGVFLFRLCIQIGSVIKIILFNNYRKESGLNFLEVSVNQLPFSFFNYIVYNPEKHSRKDLQLILEHEKIHAQQIHSADILLVNLVSCILWFNPFAWLYRKSVEQNLEFIADRETVNNTAEIKEYQHALVKVSIADLRPALTNHFYQSFIKKRILMLNKKSSSQSPAWKLSLAMPLILAFMLLFNVKTEAQIVEKEKAKSEKAEAPEPEEEIRLEISEDTEPAEAPEQNEIIEITSDEEPEKVHALKIKEEKIKNPAEILGNNPLYIINNKEYKSSRLDNKYIGVNSRIRFMSKEEASRTYGKNGVNGAVIIPDGVIIKNFDKKLKEAQELSTSFSGKFLSVGQNGKPSLLEINSSNKENEAIIKPYKTLVSTTSNSGQGMVWKTKNAPHIESTYTIRRSNRNSSTNDGKISYQYKSVEGRSISNSKATGVKITTQDEEPLYIVDGEIQTTDFISSDIQPENIASINVLKGINATKKYGKKGSHGVIEIFTKKETNGLTDSLFLISSTLTGSEIEKLKADVRTKTGYTLDVNNIERNADGQIINIAVKFYNSNSMVQSSYSNENGIPHIHVGLRNGGGLIISASE